MSKSNPSLHPRYYIRKKIGEGGMAVVYQAWDRVAEKEIALKVSISESGDERLRSEFAILHGLHHPSLPGVYNLHALPDGRWMYSMDWIPEASLADWIARGQTLDREPFGMFLQELLSAIQLLHAHGILHRDIKTQNILVDENGHPTLIDFGLSCRSNDPRALEPEGTLQYTAPEMIKKESCDARSDLYSLGVVLYEWLTGINPFDDPNVVNVVVHHLQKKIESVPASVSWMNKELESIIVKLLEKDPTLRFHNVFELYNTLSASDDWRNVSRPEDAIHLFFGCREDILERARAQPAESQCFTGPQGVGKTRVLDHLTLLAEQAGAEVVFVRGRRESSATQALFERLHRGTRMEDLPANWFETRQEQAFDEDSLTAELSDFFYQSLPRQQLVLAVDDLHLASAFDRRLICAIVRRKLPQHALRFVFTSMEPDPMLPADQVHTVSLEALSREQVSELACRSLNSRELPDEFLNWLFSGAHGNPYLTDQMLRSAIRSRALSWIAGQWEWRGDLVSDLPQSIETFVATQLDTLTAEERHLLRIVSVFPYGFTVEDAQRIVGSSLRGYENLIRRNVLEWNGRRLEITSRFLKETVYRELEEAERKRLHSALSQAGSAAERAFHRSRSNDPAASVPLLLEVAEEDKKLFRVAEATDKLETALSLTQDTKVRLEILVRLEELLDRQGALDRQQAVLDEWMEIAQAGRDPHSIARALFRRAVFLERHSRLTDSRTVSEEAISFSRSHDNVLLAPLLRQLGKTYYREAQYEKSETYYRESLRVAQDTGDVRHQMEAHNSLGTSLGSLGRTEDATRQFEETLDLADKLGDFLGQINARFNLGRLFLIQNDLAAARTHVNAAQSLSQRLKHRSAECQANFFLGRIAYDTQDYSSAIRSFERSEHIALEISNEDYHIRSRWNRALTLSAIGLSDEALSFVHELANVRLTSEKDIFQNVLYEGRIRGAANRLPEFREQLQEAVAFFGRTPATRAQYAIASALLLQVASVLPPGTFVPMREEEIESLQKTWGDSDRGIQVYFWDSLAQYESAGGNRQTAWKYSELAANQLRELPVYEFDAAAVYFRAYRLRRDIGRSDALDYLRQALETIRRVRDKLKDSHHRSAFTRQTLVREIESICQEEFRVSGSDASFEKIVFVANRINSVLDPARLWNEIMDTAIAHTGADRGLVLLAREDGQFTIRVARNVDQESLEDLADISQSIVREVLAKKEAVITADANHDERFKQRKSIVAYDIRSIMCVPLRAKEQILGVVYLDKRFDADHFGTEQMQFLEAFSNLAGIAVENAKLYEQLKIENTELFKENIELRHLVEDKYSTFDLVGTSAPMQRLFDLIRRAKDSDATVLVDGESGTGKELVARAIHFHSPRRRERFVAIDCGALPESLLESELFGHKKGAFTGAQSDHQGLFEEADGGSIFLDEITNTSLAFQAKLLRVLQEGEIRRVGETQTKRVDVRVIAATNRDMQAALQENLFRQDLYYRLNVLPIHVPALRERADDIPLLAQFFIRRHALSNKKSIEKISRDFLDELLSYHWPGNVRELENLMHRVVVMADGKTLTRKSLPENWKMQQTESEFPPEASLEEFEKRLQKIETDYFREILEKAGGNKSKAADLLAIKRTTLNDRLKKLGL